MIPAATMDGGTNRKRSLILHIGHHKTASSYLQKRIFPHLEKHLYLYKKSSPASAAFITAFAWSPAAWQQRGDEWFSLLAQEMDHAPADQQNGVLISSEEMSAHRIFAEAEYAHPRRDPCLLAKHVEACRSLATRHGFDLKVIICVRRQDQYFPSRFASIGRRVGELRQRNFEAQMGAILDQDRRYFIDGIWLDYWLSWRLIANAISSSSLLMLPVEMLAVDPMAFLKHLGVFLGEPVITALGTDAQAENRRQVSPDCWKLQRQGAPLLLERLLARTGIEVDAILPANQLRLTDQIKSRIHQCYQASNRRLDEELHLDLRSYGYYD